MKALSLNVILLLALICGAFAVSSKWKPMAPSYEMYIVVLVRVQEHSSLQIDTQVGGYERRKDDSDFRSNVPTDWEIRVVDNEGKLIESAYLKFKRERGAADYTPLPKDDKTKFHQGEPVIWGFLVFKFAPAAAKANLYYKGEFHSAKEIVSKAK